jgi:hypothetical protein
LFQSSSSHVDALNIIVSSGLCGQTGGDFELRNEAGTIERLSSGVASPGTSAEQSAILYLYFVCPFLPPLQISQGLKILLKMYPERSTSDQLNSLTLEFLSKAVLCVKSLEHDLDHCVETIRELVNGWVSSSDWPVNVATDKVVGSLEKVLTSLLRSNSMASTLVHLALVDHSDEIMVARCMQMNNDGVPKLKSSLLSTLIERDITRFGSQFYKQLNSLAFDGDMFENGYFDDPVLLVLGSHIVLRENRDSVLAWERSLVSRASKLLSACLVNCGATDKLLAVLLGRLKLESVDHSLFASLVMPMTTFISQTLRSQSLGQVTLPTPATVLEVAVRLCCICSSGGEDNAKILSSELLLCLSELIPHSLRFHAHSKTDGGGGNVPKPDMVLRWTTRILDEVRKYDRDCSGGTGVTTFGNMIRCCLRYGLSNKRSPGVQTKISCLRLVKTFVEAVSSDSTDLDHLCTSSKHLASQVFEMLVSHSQFDLIFSGLPERQEKSEIVLLLLVCLSSTDTITFDFSLWEKLLQSFQAGVGETDLAVRKLLTQYGKLVATVSTFVWVVYCLFDLTDLSHFYEIAFSGRRSRTAVSAQMGRRFTPCSISWSLGMAR